jgi:hypothetical protein
MRSVEQRGRVVRLAAAPLALLAACTVLAACGHGGRTSSPTTFTAPQSATAPQQTTPRPTVTPPTTRPKNVRPWRTGFADGTIPLQDSDTDLARDLDGMAATGARWFRIDFYWPTIQAGGPNSWNWSETDRVVKAAIDRGLEILAMPAYSPTWARPLGASDHHPPLDPDTYARFVYAAVKRYAPLGVHTWEIWNEPNTSAFWPPKPDPVAYTQLLRRAYVSIKSADSTAFVVSAGLAGGLDRSDGTVLSARTFLRRAYDAGAKGYFDAVGLHPTSFPAMPLDPHDWNTFYNTPELYQVMVDHGDGAKKIWGTEFSAPTGYASTAVSKVFQFNTLVAGYRAWIAWPFTGPLIWYSWRDSGNNLYDLEQNFGLVAHDGTPKPALLAFESVVHGAAGPVTQPVAKP